MCVPRFCSILLGLSLTGVLASCSSTLPTAESIDALTAQVRQQEQPRYDELSRRLAAGELSNEDYELEKAALDKRVTERVSDIAWTRHFLDQSERKSNGLPTPDMPVVVRAPNAMMGGAGAVGNVGQAAQVGSLYRPFTQQSMGAMNNPGMFGGGGGVLPGF